MSKKLDTNSSLSSCARGNGSERRDLPFWWRGKWKQVYRPHSPFSREGKLLLREKNNPTSKKDLKVRCIYVVIWGHRSSMMTMRQSMKSVKSINHWEEEFMTLFEILNSKSGKKSNRFFFPWKLRRKVMDSCPWLRIETNWRNSSSKVSLLISGNCRPSFQQGGLWRKKDKNSWEEGPNRTILKSQSERINLSQEFGNTLEAWNQSKKSRINLRWSANNSRKI